MSGAARRQLRVMVHRAKSLAAMPENTLRALSAAVQAGAELIETDLHLSRDGVLMISHDNDLRRRFGVRGLITESDYPFLRTLRTVSTPSEPMPTFGEFLRFLRELPMNNRPIQLLLDIKPNAKKTNDGAEEVMAAVNTTLRGVEADMEFWKPRILVGCWRVESVWLCREYLPGIPVMHIGFMVPYSYEFLRMPEVKAFNMRYTHLVGKDGQQFMEDAKREGKEVYAWTVGSDQWIRWAICQPALDGICTGSMERVPILERECKSLPDYSQLTLKMRIESWGWQIAAWVMFHMFYGWNWKSKLRANGKRL